jgi:tRNA (guanine6-N2)-methyltransferase
MKRSSSRESPSFAVECLPGLLPFLHAELTRLGVRSTSGADPRRHELLVSGAGVATLHRSRIAVAVYRYLEFEIPRPKALLGDVHLGRMVEVITQILAKASVPFRGFRFDAAGSDSQVFQRLAARIAEEIGQPHIPEEGDLVIRVRPRRGDRSPPGWEVLIRTTPRPLSTRPYRVANFPGAVNATVAAAMTDLAGVQSSDRVLNVMCGSGTILIERLLVGRTARAVGVDTDPHTLELAARNAQAAGVSARLQLVQADATDLPFEGETFSVAFADLPWGERVGSRGRNEAVYRDTLAELARVLVSGAPAVLLTQHVQPLERVLSKTDAWEHTRSVRIFQGGFTPTMVLLTRKS